MSNVFYHKKQQSDSFQNFDFRPNSGITRRIFIQKQKSRFCNRLMKLVELSGIEPLTSWMPFKRSPSWAITPFKYLQKYAIFESDYITTQIISKCQVFFFVLRREKKNNVFPPCIPLFFPTGRCFGIPPCHQQFFFPGIFIDSLLLFTESVPNIKRRRAFVFGINAQF